MKNVGVTKKYYFIPGHRWKLSFAELVNFFYNSRVEFNVITANYLFFLVEVSSDGWIENIDLGGIRKFGRILGNTDHPSKLVELVNGYLQSVVVSKIRFGVSIYSIRKNTRSSYRMKENLEGHIKSSLEEHNIKASYVGHLNQLETSTVVYDKKIRNKGFELAVLLDKGDCYLAECLWVHNYKKNRNFEYRRPAFDKRSGMLPVKLSKIMVNLAQSGNIQTIWDPFCGSGTILMVAVDNGYNVIGSDDSLQAINDTKDNIHWIIEKGYLGKRWEDKTSTRDTLEKYVLIQKANVNEMKSVYNEFGNVIRENIAIVFEPYLGPIVKRPLNDRRYKEVSTKVFNILNTALNKIYYIARRRKKSISSLCFVVPIYKTMKGYQSPSFKVMLRKFQGIGFGYPNAVKRLSTFTDETDITWYDKNSLIRRKIIVLHRKAVT